MTREVCGNCQFWNGEYTGLGRRVCTKYGHSMEDEDGCGNFKKEED